MIELIYKYEATIRLSIFLGSFSVLALWEWLKPRRQLTTHKFKRWANNFSLIISSTLLVRLVIPTAVVGVAYLTQKNGWGFANHFEINFWLKFIVTFVLLDLIIYFQHLFFHVLPILWRFHRVHHSDRDCDVTTGVRFHPFEIVLSVVIKMAVIIILGAPVLAVIIFEIVLNFMSMFTHSNIRINKKFENILRWFITTPEMHRIHHSTLENETNSNFTFFISLWDRIFGTYLESPRDGHTKMVLGLDRFTDPKFLNLYGLLALPFNNTIHGYAINYRDTRNADALEKINEQLKIEIQNKEKRANELIIARDKAEKANAAKSRFISNISHELRTPLHGIQSYAEFGIQRSGKVSTEKVLDYFKNIKMSGNRLLKLIESLLHIAQIESGKLTIKKLDSDLVEVIDACIVRQQTRLEELGLAIKINKLTESTTALFDPVMIGQVITNLVSNAIKFSPSNSTIDITVSEENKTALYFSIHDQGIGVPDNELNDIFTPFAQSSRTETGAGGTGLGLTISKDIIEAHGGKIWAENNSRYSGTTFIFYIPK